MSLFLQDFRLRGNDGDGKIRFIAKLEFGIADVLPAEDSYSWMGCSGLVGAIAAEPGGEVRDRMQGQTV